MKNRAPIQDAIDRRNFKQDLASTVIKRSRVRFVTEEDLEEEKLTESMSADGTQDFSDDYSDGFADDFADDEEAILERIMAQNDPYSDVSQLLEDGDAWGAGQERHGLVDEPDLDLSGYSEDVLSAADEILARLKREAEEDEEMRKQEWLAKLANGEV